MKHLQNAFNSNATFLVAYIQVRKTQFLSNTVHHTSWHPSLAQLFYQKARWGQANIQ